MGELVPCTVDCTVDTLSCHGTEDQESGPGVNSGWDPGPIGYEW
jgi:hypothetical protein